MRELFENEWFPRANALGVTWEEFWKMNPRIIKAICRGYREKEKIRDREMWSWFGNYGISAMVFAIEHCFSEKPKTSYLEKPITEEIGKELTEELTEEEKKRQTEQLFLKLRIMGANFNLNHNKGGTGS